MTNKILNTLEEEKNINDQLLSIILKISQRLSDPSMVEEVSSSKENLITIAGIDLIPWESLSMSHGLPGICLLFGELDSMFQDDSWDIVGHSFMLEIQNNIQYPGIEATSSFSGLAGIGLAARALSRNGTRYQNFIKNINDALIEKVKFRLMDINGRLPNRVHMSDYDVIEGLSGIGRYLLFYKDNNKTANLISDILDYLVKISKDILIKGEKIPGWFIPSENQFLETEKQINPIGNFNCGMSHGITGPMAFMAIALMNGMEVEGQRESIHKIGKWLLDRKSIINESGFYFPPTVSWEQELENAYSTAPSRDAWCYGSPGVSRALYLAGKSLGNEEFILASQQAIDSIFRRTQEEWGLASPTFCHGLSGLLHITNLMNISMDSTKLEKEMTRLINIILNAYDENHPFGFQDTENLGSRIKPINKAGLLDGATGVLLVLLAYFNKKSYTEWDSLFMLN